jgi:hypothetical protein
LRALPVVLLGLTLAGCSETARTARLQTTAPPVSEWQESTGDSATYAEPAESAAEARTLFVSAESMATLGPEATVSMSALEPMAVHEARIEMAREALVEDNLNKERIDLAEELQRELAALQANSETSKSRVKHGGQTKKQP